MTALAQPRQQARQQGRQSVRQQVRRFAQNIDAATPPHRDRAVDALRALAIAGVIGGHWLVTALVSGASQHGPVPSNTVLSDNSPLASMPWLAPLSWIFQTLAVFFLVGGYAAAKSYKGEYLPWLRKRLARLARPVAALVAVWIPVTVGMLLAGVPHATVHTILFLVISPLWFLLVYAGLTALTPFVIKLVRRFGASAAIFPASLVAAADLLRFGLHGPSWVAWINCIWGRLTSASTIGPMPEPLEQNRYGVPVSSICSSIKSPPVPVIVRT